MAFLTSANATFTLVIPGLFPAAQTIQGWATDDFMSVDKYKLSENVIGVDGRKSSGFIPTLKLTTISLQADSQSNDIFSYWIQAMEKAREIYRGEGTIIYPSINKSASLTYGTLEDVQKIPSIKKQLEMMQYTINWESINVAIL